MNDRPNVTCRELIEFLMDYVEGQLAMERRAEFDRHLSGCPSCVAYLRSYIETIRLGKAAMAPPESDAPRDVPEDLIRAILAARER